MLRNVRKLRPRERADDVVAAWTDWSLQFILWMLWTLAVIAAAYLSWRADALAQRPTELLGLVIHCGLTGIVGLVVLTVIEMRLEPWRFLDD